MKLWYIVVENLVVTLAILVVWMIWMKVVLDIMLDWIDNKKNDQKKEVFRDGKQHDKECNNPK